MLLEKYVDIPITLEGSNEPEIVEVYVKDDEIRHYIDTYLSAEDVLNYAKQIDSSLFRDESKVDLDMAYDLLVNEFDEHDDIADIRDLNEYIQNCIDTDYYDEAEDVLLTAMENNKADEQEQVL